MIDIPVGKALAPVEAKFDYFEEYCSACCLGEYGTTCCGMRCASNAREDGKTVFFKLVDCPGEVKQ